MTSDDCTINYGWSLENAVRFSRLNDAVDYSKRFSSDAILFKFGLFEFSCAPCSSALISAMLDTYKEDGRLPPMYEIINGPNKRLYADFEREFEEKLSGESERDLMESVLSHFTKEVRDVIQRAKGNCPDRLQCMVAANHRMKNKKYYFSMHVIVSNVYFETHNNGMKRFMMSVKSNAPPEIRDVFDLNVYHHNQAYRFIYSSKNDTDPLLLPWDVKQNKPFNDNNDQETILRLMGSAFVSQQPIDEAVIITNNDIEDVFGTISLDNRVSKCTTSVGNKRKRLQMIEDETDVVQESETVDQKIVILILPRLSKQRVEDYAKWIQVGFGIASVFDNNPSAGLQLFHDFSRQSEKYCALTCANVYKNANKNMTIEHFMTWINEDVSTNDARGLLEEIEKIRASGLNTLRETMNASESIQFDLILKMVQQCNAGNITKNDAIEKIIDYMNRFIMFVSSSVIGSYIDEGVQGSMVIRPRRGIIDAYEHFSVQFARDKRPSSIIDLWLKHPKRRIINKIVFEPHVELPDMRKNVKNLFKGFAISRSQSIEGDVTLFLKHIKEIWASDNDDLYEYIINWFAHLIQFPGKKMGTVLVIKGEQGAGKGVIMDRFISKIIGQEHYMQIFNMEHLTGNFQSRHIRTNLLSFMDESSFAGNRKEAAQFKALITEDKRRYNEKHMPAMFVENCSNYIVASNQEQMVYVEPKDRRFVPFECSNKYSGSQNAEIVKYFKGLFDTDVHAVAHFLYERDLSTFNPRQTPRTEYHKYQKIINLDSPGVFINRLLEYGRIETLDPETKIWRYITLDKTADTDVIKSDVFDAYNAMKFGNFREHVSVERFFKAFYAYLELNPKQCVQMRRDGFGRKRHLLLPSLTELRTRFCRRMGDDKWFEDVDDETDTDEE